MTDEQPALERLESFAITLETKQRYSEHNRLALLAAHSVGALLAAILLAIDAPSTTVVALIGEDATNYFNVLPAIGGGILFLGLALGRNLIAEAIGMLIILAWDLGMAAAFAIQSRVNAHDGNPATIPASYPLAVYGTLGALMVIHLVTMASIIRQGERRAVKKARRG